MDWTEYFVNFMNQIPGGYVILGLIGGGVVISPFIPKIVNAYRSFKKAKEEARQVEEDRKKKEDEERLEQIAEEREFRRKVTTVMDSFGEMAGRIEDLSETARELKSTSKELANANESLSKTLSDHIDTMDKKVDALSGKMEKLEIASQAGDERLRGDICGIHQNLETVTKQVGMIVESDLDDFRSYLIEMHNRHVYDHEPMTKRDIEIFCMKFKKYKAEGGNGWAEKMYFEVLQCPTVDGERAEDVAERFHYLIDTAMAKKHEESAEHADPIS